MLYVGPMNLAIRVSRVCYALNKSPINDRTHKSDSNITFVIGCEASLMGLIRSRLYREDNTFSGLCDVLSDFISFSNTLN